MAQSVNELLSQQETVFKHLKQNCSNYKRDGPSRKTLEYLEDRLTRLTKNWEQFGRNHQLLEESEATDHQYFTDDVYNTTKRMYEDVLQDILKRKAGLLATSTSQAESDGVSPSASTVQVKASFNFDDIRFHVPPRDTSETNDKQQELLRQQYCNFRAFQRAVDKINLTLTNTKEKWELEDDLNILKTKWEYIEKANWQLDYILQDEDSIYKQKYDAAENIYDDIRKKLQHKIWNNAHYEKSTPKIEIPDFNGKYSQWLTFRDLYVESVHNNPVLSKAQKMQHLKTKLKGDAEKLVQHLGISAENYSSCWEILTHRYDNKRLLFTSYMNTLLNQPTIQQASATSIRKLHDIMLECLNGLSNIGLDISNWDPIVVHLLVQKLDSVTYNEYIKDVKDPRGFPDLKEFTKFLESKFMALEVLQGNSQKSSTSNKPGKSDKQTNYASEVENNTSRSSSYFKKSQYSPKVLFTAARNCPLCKMDHVLMKCDKFIAMNTKTRGETVRKMHICPNCLYDHEEKECNSRKTCKVCRKAHHTLLHDANLEQSDEQSSQRTSSSSSSSTSNSYAVNNILDYEKEVLLTTVLLKVKSIDGEYLNLRGLIDQGSQVSLITESAAQRLRLPRRKMSAVISGVGALAYNCKGAINLECKSIHSDYSFNIETLIMNKLTSNLPTASFSINNWTYLENLKLADPHFNTSGPIDLLLGADIYTELILNGVIKGENSCYPVAQQTKVGWILCGKIKTFNCFVTLNGLENNSRFRETEDITSTTDMSTSTTEELHYKDYSTSTRLTNGQYVVEMPRKPYYESNMNSNKFQTSALFSQLERQLQDNKETSKDDYGEDNSSITTTGLDLNNIQNKGPYTQPNIANLIDEQTKKPTEMETITGKACVISPITQEGGTTTTLLANKTRVATLVLDITSLPQQKLSGAGGALLHSQIIFKATEAFKGYNSRDITLYRMYFTLTIRLHSNLWWKRTLFLRTWEGNNIPKTLCIHTTTTGLKLTKVTTLPKCDETDTSIEQLINSKIKDSSLTCVTRVTARAKYGNNYLITRKNELYLKLTNYKNFTITTLPTKRNSRPTQYKINILKRPVDKLSPLPQKLETSQKQGERMDATSSLKVHTNKHRIRTKLAAIKISKTLIITLFTMFTLATEVHSAYSGTHSGAHITSLEPDRPVYYDALGKMQTIHDEWTLLMYYNLTNYWNGLLRVENYLHNLTDLCHKTDPRYCEPTLGQLSHEMELLEHYNNILLAPHQHLGNRKKRGLINGIGSIANSLFGVLDQEFADKYHQDIEAIQKNQNYLLGLMKNQTSIVELENQALKKTEDHIHQQLNLVDNFMNETNYNLAKVESTMEIIMATSYFNSASLATYLLLKNLREMQELLFDTLTNVYKGHMDVHLLTPVNLIEQLNVISGSLPKRLSLPLVNVKDDIKDIYKLLYMKARVTSNYFLFEVHIPLTSDEDFLLYKVTPLPVRNETEFTIIQLQSQYIAINFKKNSYILPSDQEIKMCTVMKQEQLICNKNMPIYSLDSKTAPCEAKLLSHNTNSPCDVRKTSCSDVWVELHPRNSWLAVCCGACTLRIVCDNSDVTAYTMNSSAIVTLQQGCLLQSRDFTIYSRNEYNTNINMEANFNIPQLNSTVNNIVNLTYHNIPWEIQRRAEEVQDIDRRLLFQKEREILPQQLSSHDLHQYAICYTLLAVAIIIIIIWVVRKYLPQRCSNKLHNGDIELQQRTTKEKTLQKARVKLERTDKDNIAFTFDE